MNELIQKVEQWAIDRNLHTASPQGQALKVVEEFTETLIAMDENCEEEVIDGIGDTYVTLIILCKQLEIKYTESAIKKYLQGDEQRLSMTGSLNWLVSGVAKNDIDSARLGVMGLLTSLDRLTELYETTPEHCLSVAYNEIKDRKGKMIDGVFVKESDLHGNNS